MNIYKVTLIRRVFIKAEGNEQAVECAKELVDRFWESEEIEASMYVMGKDVDRWKEDEYVDATKWKEKK